MKQTIVRVLKNLDLIIAGIALAVLILATFVGVIMRYVFSNPFTWMEEVQLWCFLWIVFLGSGAAFRTGNHVAIEFIVDAMPPKVKRVFEIFDYIVVIFILCYLGVQSSTLIRQYAATNVQTSILNVPQSFISLAIPAGCVLMIVDYTANMVQNIFVKRRDNAEGGEDA